MDADSAAAAAAAAADGGDAGASGGIAFRKRARGGAIRRRGDGEAAVAAGVESPAADDDGDAGESAVVKRDRKEAASVFVQRTRSTKRELGDFEVFYSSSGTAASSLPADQNASASLEVDTAQDRDAEALLLKQVALTRELADKAIDNVYRGQAGYLKYALKQDAEKGAKYRIGPQRAAANIRTTIRFDYQPDVCKDYKETGFCGYGDSCKFLHDRSDYKAGWQLEREWDEEQKRKRELAALGIGEDGEALKEEEKPDELPFACLLCRGDFRSPVVTKCGHYFCEPCALKNFAKTPKCFACGADTTGVFMTAKDLVRRLKEREERQENAQLTGHGQDDDGGGQSAAAPRAAKADGDDDGDDGHAYDGSYAIDDYEPTVEIVQ